VDQSHSSPESVLETCRAFKWAGRVLGSNEVAFLTRSAGRALFTFFNERPATPGVRIGMATAEYRFGGFGVV